MKKGCSVGFFDVFNTNNEPPKISLMSRLIEGNEKAEPHCLTFWFAPIGNDPDTKLIIYRESAAAITNNADGEKESPLQVRAGLYSVLSLYSIVLY